MNDSSPYHARKVSSGTCVMTCALLRCSNALGVEYEHCCPCAFFLHGTPRSPLGTAVLANAMYKAGFSPWSLDFFSMFGIALKKQTSFSDYYAHDCISARARISPTRIRTTLCDDLVCAMCCFCFVALHLSNWQVSAVTRYSVILVFKATKCLGLFLRTWRTVHAYVLEIVAWHVGAYVSYMVSTMLSSWGTHAVLRCVCK